ncbi:hypothetical protein [Sphingopyxis sp. GC21]|uniref:hypothetical protein n=1 Tax=Sphingopyxis sp. GC21 TaxID=2933562 RepID=UPI0021E4E20B|nr:hypothetical protein [Sphingopyxis sp. GC21]
MPQTKLMAARLQQDVPAAEAKVDDAIIALSSLMTSMVTARRESGVPAKTGQATILRLAKAQMSLVDVSSDVLRIHGDLIEIGKETGSYDLRDCPNGSAGTTPHLAAVA